MHALSCFFLGGFQGVGLGQGVGQYAAVPNVAGQDEYQFGREHTGSLAGDVALVLMDHVCC
jgi:hypothetical protein